MQYGLVKWWNADNWGSFPNQVVWEAQIDDAVRWYETKRWKDSLVDMPTLINYRRIKKDLQFEEYLERSYGFRKGTVIRAKLRSGTNALRISQGRQKNIPREQRVCLVCNKGVIEDEIHFVMDCDALVRSRKMMWDAIMVSVKKTPKVLMAINAMTRDEKFDFVLGKSQMFEVTQGTQRAIERGLVGLYTERKACRYDIVI